MTVGGVSFHTPKTAEDLLEMLEKGNRNRTQHPTDANQESSRSHAVFQVCFDCHPRVVFFHDWVDLAFEVLSRKLVWLKTKLSVDVYAKENMGRVRNINNFR